MRIRLKVVLCGLLPLMFTHGCKTRVESTISFTNSEEIPATLFPTVGSLTFRYDELKKNEAVKTLNFIFCTATLICSDAVITAAHCTHNRHEKFLETASVFEGLFDTKTSNFQYSFKLSDGKEIPLKGIVDEVETPNEKFDMAIVKLNEPVPSFVNLPKVGFVEANFSPQINQPLVALGWGNRPKMTEKDVRQRRLAKTRFSGTYVEKEGLYKMTRKDGDVLSCSGDSGGPWMVLVNNLVQIFALTKGRDESEEYNKRISKLPAAERSLANIKLDEDCPEGGDANKVQLLTPTSYNMNWIIETANKVCSDPSTIVIGNAARPIPKKVDVYFQ